MYLDTKLMIMKSSKWLIFQLLSILVTNCLCSCQNNDDLPVCDISGEWMGSYIDENQTSMTTVEFTTGGGFKEWNAYISKESNSNVEHEGTYINNGKIDIIYSTKDVEQYYPRQFHKIWRIIKTDKYLLHIYDETTGEEQTYRKVIDTYNMNLDEQRTIIVNDADFRAVEFRSCDERIATVNDLGEIHAVKRGTTFIRVVAPNGEAVFRVNVLEKNEIIDDYTKYFISSINKIKNEYGLTYNEGIDEEENDFISYNLLDDNVKKVEFHYVTNDYLSYIDVYIKNSSDINAIISSFDSKYEIIEKKDKIHSYNCQVNGLRIVCVLLEEFHVIRYLPDRNNFELFDHLISAPIDKFMRCFNINKDSVVPFDYLIKYGNVEIYAKADAWVVDTDIFEDVLVIWEETTNNILELLLICKDGVNVSDIDDWYKSHYILQEHRLAGTVYTPSESFMRSEYYITLGIVNLDELGLGDRTVVTYFSNKLRH